MKRHKPSGSRFVLDVLVGSCCLFHTLLVDFCSFWCVGELRDDCFPSDQIKMKNKNRAEAKDLPAAQESSSAHVELITRANIRSE